MKTRFIPALVLLLLCGLPANAQPKDGKSIQVSAGEVVTWGKEPVEVVTPTRGEIVLNGLWRFQPGTEGAKEPGTDWGYVRVPGSWRTGYTTIAIPGVVASGSSEAWENWRNDTLNQGWYERPIAIPADWKGRAIILDLSRVSTDAWVYVDGKEAGRVSWPGGEVDLTRFAAPGQEHQLRIFVAAIASPELVGRFMGPGAGQVSFGKATLESKGLIDDVVLKSRPLDAHISDIFVQPSTRRKQIALTIELSGVKETGSIHLIAQMEREGKVEKTFESDVTVEAVPVQTLEVAWPWPDPALWDLDKPYLYTLKLSAEGAYLKDVYSQPFGFREVWVDGRKIYLNGIELRLRPNNVPEQWTQISGTREYVEGTLKGMRWARFNIGEMWPYEAHRRGQQHFHEVVYDATDHLGFPLMGSAGNMNDDVGWREGDWKSPAIRAEWERQTTLELRRSRNHPSVLMWTSSANSFGQANDQHPLALGRDNWYADDYLIRRAAVMQGALAYMRHVDPSRPVFIHQSLLGDLDAVNTYLDLTPLQEREEWLSAWSQKGDKPYVAIEFGTPYTPTFQRGRGDYTQAVTTEPWLTEFAAAYFGPAAYRMETPAYRAAVRERFEKEQQYTSWHGNPQLDFAPSAQAVQVLFVRNTWRSWRTWGITGGMVPWGSAQGWEYEELGTIDAPPFQPGRRGTYVPKLAKSSLFSYRPEGGHRTNAAGKALMANNDPTLVYIAGKPAAFTDKQHAFWSDQLVEKQLVLICDERTPQSYRVTWRAKVGRKLIASGGKTGTISPASNLFIPISFQSPQVNSKTNGVIEMSAIIGSAAHTDQLKFRIFPRQAKEHGLVTVFDPVGKTTAMLKSLGFTTRTWNGKLSKELLIIGREALSSKRYLPGSLENYVRNGGRIICFAQQPSDLERLWSLRVSRHVSRRVFTIPSSIPSLGNLDSIDLCDWAGSGDLRPTSDPLSTRDAEPPYGWHWGNRGSVSSAAVEKPHLSGWRPLLECEFDGAYTPLMELDHDSGRAILCLMDLEGRTREEPAANTLARAVLHYARVAPLRPRSAHTVLLGKAPSWFDGLNIDANKASYLPANADLVIVASDAAVNEKALLAYAKRGGKVVFLPRRTSAAPLGLTLEEQDRVGSLDVPSWSLADGLSASDLRWRNEAKAWLAQKGAVIGAGGQLAMRSIGKGVIVWLQLDPDRFDADRLTYFRFTRWRQTRAIAQVLANLGATFHADASTLATQRDPASLPLAGLWSLIFTRLTPGAESPDKPTPDPGISSAAQELVRDGSQAAWKTATLPDMFTEFQTKDGEAVVRKVVDIPEGWAGKDLVVSLGIVDDFDTTFWNGSVIGTTDNRTPNTWNFPRKYTIPGRLVKPGRNVLAVRIFDHFGNGGFSSSPDELTIRPADKAPVRLYHQDYRSDFVLGDDPFRYKRW